MRKQKKMTLIYECEECGGSGIYTHNPSFHDGAALVCRSCNGKGYMEFNYTPFTGRKPTPSGVKRIFKAKPFSGPYYSENHTFEDGKTVEYSKYGCTVEEWEKGVKPKPVPDKLLNK